MVTLRSLEHKPSRVIMDALESLQLFIGKIFQQNIAVIQHGFDELSRRESSAKKCYSIIITITIIMIIIIR